MGDKAGEGQSYGNLGKAYQGLRQFRTAIEHHQCHLEIAKEMEDKAGEGKSYGNLSNNKETRLERDEVMAVSATPIMV